MNKKDIGGVIFLSLILIALLSMMVLITMLMVDGITSEYKYSIDIPCYDKFGSEIYNLTCEKEIHCGNVFNTRSVNGNIYSCDNKIGLISTSKQHDVFGRVSK